MEARRGHRSHGAGVAGGCELLDMGHGKFMEPPARALCPHNH